LNKYLKTNITLICLVISNIHIYSQLLEVKKNDSTLLRKSDKKNEYYITLFNKENIKYNKRNGFKYDTIPHIGTVIKCNECKVESYGFLVRKIKNNKKIKVLFVLLKICLKIEKALILEEVTFL